MSSKICKICGTTNSPRWNGRVCRNCDVSSQKNRYVNNRQKNIDTAMKWRELNMEKYRKMQREYHQKRYADPDWKQKHLAKNLFGMFLRCYIGHNILKVKVTRIPQPQTIKKHEKLLGISIGAFIGRLEQRFQKRYGQPVDWNDFFIRTGDDKLEVEHIKPLHDFDFTVAGEKEKAFHYSNLEILCRRDNRPGRKIKMAI